jgi:alkanesulfonate monooxygenase SsuD/methylene tetrahydromethanopterin reductase-like flavin-dependent oxidoreductase (luciferase family)
VSNADVSHGWYGVPWDKPLQRTREYVEIVRMALRGEPVRYQGKQYQLPPAGTTEAAHLRAAPIRADIPIYLAGVGPAALELTGEIADGWIGVMCPPERLEESLIRVRKGREKIGRGLDGFEVLPSVPISVGADLREAAGHVRGYFANFIGLGSKERSVYSKLVTDMGFGDAADEIRAHNQAGDRAAAAAAVPFEFLDRTSLLGSTERIAVRMRQYAAAGVTTLGLTPLAVGVDAQLEVLRTAAEALRLSKI